MSLLKQTAGSTAVQLMSSAFAGQPSKQVQPRTTLFALMQMQQRPANNLKAVQQQQQGLTL